MLQRSPILRFALEVFEHALESGISKRPRDRKLAVINLAQCVELAVKAALVEKNVSIYEKGAKTLNSHDALKALAGLWGVDRVAMHARLEVLIDERNAIQHRYGDVDEVTLDYHLETAVEMLSEVLRREFDTELVDWVRDTVDAPVWKQVRFFRVSQDEPSRPTEASLPERSATLDLIDGFSRYESAVRQVVDAAGGGGIRFGSTLDLAIKVLASLESPPQALITQLPGAYRLRNKVVHGEAAAAEAEVVAALTNLDLTIAALQSAPGDLVKRAIQTVRLGVRGARVLSAEEIATLEAARLADQPRPAAHAPEPESA